MVRKGNGGDMKSLLLFCVLVSLGLSKEEVLEEIDKIYKGILVF